MTQTEHSKLISRRLPLFKTVMRNITLSNLMMRRMTLTSPMFVRPRLTSTTGLNIKNSKFSKLSTKMFFDGPQRLRVENSLFKNIKGNFIGRSSVIEETLSFTSNLDSCDFIGCQIINIDFQVTITECSFLKCSFSNIRNNSIGVYDCTFDKCVFEMFTPSIVCDTIEIKNSKFSDYKYIKMNRITFEKYFGVENSNITNSLSTNYVSYTGSFKMLNCELNYYSEALVYSLSTGTQKEVSDIIVHHSYTPNGLFSLFSSVVIDNGYFFENDGCLINIFYDVTITNCYSDATSKAYLENIKLTNEYEVTEDFTGRFHSKLMQSINTFEDIIKNDETVTINQPVY